MDGNVRAFQLHLKNIGPENPVLFLTPYIVGNKTYQKMRPTPDWSIQEKSSPQSLWINQTSTTDLVCPLSDDPKFMELRAKQSNQIYCG